MRKMKALLGMLLSVLLLHTICFPVKAAENTYTIRIYAGQQGIMTECIGGNGYITEDGRTFVLSGLGYGERVSVSYTLLQKGDSISGGDTPAEDQYNYFVLTVRRGEPNDPSQTTTIRFRTESKYNIIGSRESGKDNSERIGSETVECDRDYVIAYGLMKDAVEYTIHYVDEAGNPLRESDRYYGTVGDKPVISYQYFEGYQPQAYNLTKTLSANGADNVFTFVYSRVQEPGTNVITVPGDTGASGPAGEQQEGTVTVLPGEEGGALEGGGADQTEIPDEPVPQAPPQETIDLDDGDVPLAEFDGEENKLIGMLSGNAFLVNIPLPVKIVLLCIFLLTLGGGIWWLVKSRRKEKGDVPDIGGKT